MTRRTCLVALGGLAACRRKPPTDVRVVAMPYLNMASLFLAHESGYFKDVGLNLQIREIDRSQVAIPLLAGGEEDVAFFGPSASLLNAIARGARLRIAAGRYLISSGCPQGRRLYGSQRAFPNGFTDFRQVKGKSACLGRASIGISGFIWSEVLKAAGLKPEDVSLLNVNDQNASAALLASGKLDVLLPSAEYDIGLTPLRDRVVPGPPISAVIPDFMYSVIIFGKRFLDQSPEEGVQFLRAYFRGARAFLGGQNPDFLNRLAKQQDFDVQLLRGMCRDGVVTDGRIRMGDLQRFIDWAVEQKLAEGPIRAEDLVDTRFLNQAHLS